jgi:Tfp pilus assembly protein PilO
MSYYFKVCETDTPEKIQDMIDTCQEELEEITKKRDESLKNNGPNTLNWVARIKVLQVRLRQLKADLSLKLKQMTSKTNIKESLDEMKILFDT